MNQLAASLGLTQATIDARLRTLSLGISDRQLLQKAAPAAEANAPQFIEALYARLTRTPATAIWFKRPELLEHLKRQQRHYLSDLFSGTINWDYVQRRLQIGVAHHRVRLTPRWYIATCSHFCCDHVPLLFSTAASLDEGVEQLIALTKTILFDASLVLDAYGMALERSMRSGESQPRFEESEASPAPHGTRAQGVYGNLQKSPLTGMRLTADDCEERQRFLGFDESTLPILNSLQPTLRRVLPEMLQEFYTVFRSWPETSRLLTDDVVDRLLQQVSSYWIELTQGRFDRPYAASRTRIGIVHEQIGVSPQLYLIGLGRQIASILRAVTRESSDPAAAAASLLRAVFFDVSFIMDAYMDARAASVLRSEGYASQLLACLTVGVAVLGRDLRVRSANPALLQLLGVEAGVVQHMHATDLVPDTRVGALLKRVLEDHRRRETVQLSYGGRRLRVTGVHMDSDGTDANADPLALLVDDVTDLTTMAPELDQAEKRLFETVATVDVVLWETEPQGWIMSMISSPVLQLTGMRDLHFLGRPRAWLDMIPEPDRSRFTDQCSTLALNQRYASIHRVIHANGGTRWVRTHVVRAGSTMAESVLRGVSMDISSSFLDEKRRLEAVSRLAGSVAHEFNGLLTVISGSLELIGEDVLPGAEVEIKSAKDAVSRGATLTRHLQTFAQGTPLRLVPASLNEIIQSLDQALRQCAGPSIDVAMDLNERLWPCEIDPEQLGGMLLNLVVNARESMPLGGRLRVGTRNVAASEIYPAADVTRFEDHVEVAIADTGAGMENETRIRSIEPFFTTKSGGVGLGLSVVHGFVKQSRGHLLIESGLERGTTIRLRFPRFIEAGPIDPAFPSDRPHAKRVLIVEDDRAVATVLQRMLQRRGYSAKIVHTPQAGLDEIASEVPDLVISDIIFEGEARGAALGKKLQSILPDLPVIFMSGYTQASLHLTSEALFLPKPFSFADLEAQLKRVWPK